jgi:hypothetical protein
MSYSYLSRIIVHKDKTREELENERLERILAMAPKPRMKLMIEMLDLAIAMKNGPIKLPSGKGVILRQKSEK